MFTNQSIIFRFFRSLKNRLFGAKDPESSSKQMEQDQRPPKEPGTYGSGTMQ